MNYKTHSSFNLLLALPLTAGLLYYFFHPPTILLSLYAATFFYSTLFMSPDLDLSYQIKLLSIRGFFSIPFRLYGRVFRHRGISHTPILGSITRIIWLSLFAALVFVLVYQTIPTTDSMLLFAKKHSQYILYAFLGIVVADLSHLLLDLK